MDLELIEPESSAAQRPTPLLFVHGAWHGAWCWQEYFLPYFSRAGFAVYALSLRGHGRSAGRDRLRWARVKDYVDDVESAVGRLPSHPVLIGHSMGGAVVQKYLERHAAPAGVLLASVPPAGVLATTLRITRRHPTAFLKANLTLSLYPLIATPALAQEHFFSPTMPNDQLMSYVRRLQDESYCAFLDMLALNLPRPRRVTTPILVLGAANDTIFHPPEVEATARAYGTNATIFPNMAHDMMLEAGWRDVADHMLGWFDERGF
jgi:pimeloyl-ACP methyl ester carboxylesterase